MHKHNNPLRPSLREKFRKTNRAFLRVQFPQKFSTFPDCKNLYISQCRKNRKICDESELETIADTSTSIEEKLSDKQQAVQIHGILHNIEEPYKEVFNLRVFGELSFKQIADIFGKTESWARVTYYRAKVKIIEQMEE